MASWRCGPCRPPSPLETQSTFCTDRDTLLDFQFELQGLISRLEVWLSDPNASAPQEKVGETNFFFRGSKLVGFIALDTNGDNKIQLNGQSWPAIVVTPTEKRVWVRAYNLDQTRGFVKAMNTMSPSTGANCDPIFPYGQP